jgi:O-antigen/teichoic acid export membrane protein/O-antigen ligase
MPVDALRGLPWTLLTYALSRVVTVLTTLLLARLLAPADFGLFALAVLGMELLSVFSGLWLAAALIVRPDLDRRAEGTVLSLVTGAGFLLAIVLVAVSPALAAFFGEPRLTGIVALLAAVLLVSGVNWFYETLLQRELAFRRRFACLMARTLAFSAVALCLAVAGAGVWSLVGAYLAGYLTSGAALLVLAPYRVRPAFDRAEAARVLRSGRGFLAQDLAVFLGENADYLAVGRVLGSAQLGFYAMAFRQAELPNYAIAEPVGKVTFPTFAQMHHRGEDVRATFLRTLRLMALATVPAGVILSAAATPFAVALFGADWAPMAAPLAVLGVWAALRPLQVTIGQLLNSLGRADAYGRVSLVLLVPFVGGTFAAATLGGITAVAWTLLAHLCVMCALLALAVARHAQISVAAQARAVWPLAAAGAVSWVATRAVVSAAESAPAAGGLAAAVAVCLTAYVATVELLAPGLLSSAVRGAARALGVEAALRTAVLPTLAVAAAALLGALAAAEPKLAVALVAGVLLLALPFVAPVAHLVLLLLVTAVVPFDVQNGFAFGGGEGSPGVLLSDVLLFGGLARAALVLLDTPLERRPRWALALLTAVLAAAVLQLLHGLDAGADAGTGGAELRVLLGFGALAIALPILAEPAQRAALFKGFVGVGLAVGLWGLVQWTIDIPFVASEDAGVREGVRFTSAGRGQIQGGLFAFPVAIVMGVAALLSEHVRSARARALLAVVVGLNAVDLVLTYERTFWVATLLALALLAVRARPAQRTRAVAIGGALIALVLGGMAVAMPRDLTAARERLMSIGHYGSDLSVRYRLTESRHVMDEIRARPLVGSGLGATILWGRAYEGVRPTAESFAHNGYLWLAWKLGLPTAGVLVLLFLVAALWRRPRGPTTLESIRGGAQAALVLLLLASLTFPAFEALGITAVMGVLGALAFAPREAST